MTDHELLTEKILERKGDQKGHWRGNMQPCSSILVLVWIHKCLVGQNCL